MLHIRADCQVSEVTLDTVLGPAVIDAMGNPRVMILINNAIVQNEVQKIFDKAGYMIINPAQANIIKNIDLDAAKMTGDYKLIRDTARDFHADVLITGDAGASLVNKQVVYGQAIYVVAGRVKLEAVLANTAQTIASDEFSWRPRNAKEFTLSYQEGEYKGLRRCASQAAISIVNQVAYALTQGSGIPGASVKIIVNNIDYNNARALQSKLADIQGVSGVYRRNYTGGAKLELDVNSDKTPDELADILADLNFIITHAASGLIEAEFK